MIQNDLFLYMTKLQKFYSAQAFDRCSLLNGCDIFFDKFVKSEDTVLEIGTHQGITTGYLAQKCREVITMDIHYNPHGLLVWEYLKVKNIKYITINDNSLKRNIIHGFKFDLAFIDGDHDGWAPLYDFLLVKKCGRVIFDDITIEGVARVIKRLPEKEIVARTESVLYWRKNV